MIHAMIDYVATAVFISSSPKYVLAAVWARLRAHFTQELAGFGGDTSFAKAEAESHITRRLFRGLVSLRPTYLLVLVLIYPSAHFFGCHWRAHLSSRRQSTTHQRSFSPWRSNERSDVPHQQPGTARREYDMDIRPPVTITSDLFAFRGCTRR